MISAGILSGGQPIFSAERFEMFYPSKKDQKPSGELQKALHHLAECVPDASIDELGAATAFLHKHLREALGDAKFAYGERYPAGLRGLIYLIECQLRATIQ